MLDCLCLFNARALARIVIASDLFTEYNQEHGDNQSEDAIAKNKKLRTSKIFTIVVLGHDTFLKHAPDKVDHLQSYYIA